MSFKGTYYRLADNWNNIIPNEFKNKPINYLEIGAFYGANILSVEKTYANHIDSKLTCIDPWIDYPEYPEYKGQQTEIYETFKENVVLIKDKLNILRGFSNEVLIELPNDTFDLIYIDGNHEPEYVLEDAVLSFRKLKINGYMIFDDYGWKSPDHTQKGIDAFLSGYSNRINVLGQRNSQVFLQKLN